MGWQALFHRLHKAIAVLAIADVRTGDATGVDMNMLPLWQSASMLLKKAFRITEGLLFQARTTGSS